MTIEPVFQAPPALRRIKVTAEPLSVYSCLYGDDPYSFLYESLEGNQSRGRYSFVGGRPRLVFRSKGERIDLQYRKRRRALTDNPLEVLRQLVGPPTDVPAVAPFIGGAVGYLGYDVVRFFETIPDNNRDDLRLPDSLFVFPEEVIVFDHVTGDVYLLVYSDSHVSERLNRMQHTLLGHACTGEQNFTGQFGCGPPRETVPMVSRTTEAGYMAAVNRAREYIHAGDVFQVVISRRFDFTVTGDSLELYKALRCTNPSPYMYF
ncbi:MAG: chorismate-binding protein, partial [Phycisphaerales bacterium]